MRPFSLGSLPVAGSLSHYQYLVGLGRLELPTPRLSSVCSNQLSYGPILRHAQVLLQIFDHLKTHALAKVDAAFVFLKKEKRGRRGSPYRHDRSHPAYCVSIVT